MDVAIVIILCLLGIILILVEIFLIPGITVAGIGGGLFAIGAIYYAYSRLGAFGGTIALVSSILVFGTAFVWLVKSKALDSTISLKTDIASTVASEDSKQVKPGNVGIAVSRINPIGKVLVSGVTMEAKSLGDFIDEETEIVVVKVSPMQLLVKVKN